ncbi:MAG TPA: NUDIX domain-containing protein [Chlamydiales bacterium]|nr:NUDIX domain-containing protein [Chlamydiales bacterium]
MKQMIHKGVYGVIQKEDKVLLVEKSRGPYLGLMDLPGGRKEGKESDSDTLIREIREETGILIKRWKFYNSFYSRFQYMVNDEVVEFCHYGKIYTIEQYDDSAIDYNCYYEDAKSCKWLGVCDVDTFTPFAKRCFS